MFADNSIKGVKDYFYAQLKGQFTEREITIFFEWASLDLFDLSKSDLLLAQRKFSESELLSFRDVVKQLQKNVPIQYVLGNAYFMDLSFKVGAGVLCPRPETEELVDLIINENQSGKLLDIGTGSGVIPISVKKYQKNIEVFGLDNSVIALEYAKSNAEKNVVSVEWIEMDILSQHPKENFDIIVSNPPYVLESDKANMQPTVLDFEPEEALFVSDDNPLKFYERIAEICAFILVPEGRLYFEIHEKFGPQIKHMLELYKFVDIQIIKDLQGKDRMIKAKKAPPIKEEP